MCVDPPVCPGGGDGPCIGPKWPSDHAPGLVKHLLDFQLPQNKTCNVKEFRDYQITHAKRVMGKTVLNILTVP